MYQAAPTTTQSYQQSQELNFESKLLSIEWLDHDGDYSVVSAALIDQFAMERFLCDFLIVALLN